MPVTPPIEQEFKNLHKYVEESEIHPPLGYRPASANTMGVKTIHRELVWEQVLLQKPVIGFLSLGSSVSPNDGDRYIATGIGSTGDYAGAVANDIIDYLTIDSFGQAYNAWDKLPPIEGMLTYVSSLGVYYFYNGSVWAELGSGSPVNNDWTEGEVRYRILSANIGMPYASEGNIKLTLMGNAMAKAELYTGGTWEVIGENLLI